jgi:histidinol-phosphate/aromatic aminotransferase/cobyric acid decarboxylase-like protein
MSGPELTRKLFIEDNILVKHCAGKTMPEADRYVRIASRTEVENRTLVEALASLLCRKVFKEDAEQITAREGH